MENHNFYFIEISSLRNQCLQHCLNDFYHDIDEIKNMIKEMKTEIMNFKEGISAILKEIKTQMKKKLEDILLEMIPSKRQSKAKENSKKRPN